MAKSLVTPRVLKSICSGQVAAGRYHHPSRAARLGTPVRSRFRIRRPTSPDFLLRDFGGCVFSGSEMQRCTNTEPGAIATGRSVDYEPRCSSRNSRIERFVYCTLGPVAITTPAGLPVWGPRSAPGSVFVDARSQTLCVDFKAKLIQNREPVGGLRSTNVHAVRLRTVDGCGFAAAQCGKALPYRQLSQNDWRLRLRFMRRSLMK